MYRKCKFYPKFPCHLNLKDFDKVAGQVCYEEFNLDRRYFPVPIPMPVYVRRYG